MPLTTNPEAGPGSPFFGRTAPVLAPAGGPRLQAVSQEAQPVFCTQGGSHPHPPQKPCLKATSLRRSLPQGSGSLSGAHHTHCPLKPREVFSHPTHFGHRSSCWCPSLALNRGKSSALLLGSFGQKGMPGGGGGRANGRNNPKVIAAPRGFAPILQPTPSGIQRSQRAQILWPQMKANQDEPKAMMYKPRSTNQDWMLPLSFGGGDSPSGASQQPFHDECKIPERTNGTPLSSLNPRRRGTQGFANMGGGAEVNPRPTALLPPT